MRYFLVIFNLVNYIARDDHDETEEQDAHGCACKYGCVQILVINSFENYFLGVVEDNCRFGVRLLCADGLAAYCFIVSGITNEFQLEIPLACSGGVLVIVFNNHIALVPIRELDVTSIVSVN